MKIFEIHELVDRIKGVLYLLQDRGKIIARMVPTSEPQHPLIHERSEAWKNLERLAHDIGTHWLDNVTAVDAVHDIRREL